MNLRASLSRLFPLLASAAAVAGGCELVAGLDKDQKLDPTGGAGGTAGGGGSGAGGATGGSGGGGDACQLKTFPPPPMNAPPGGTTEFVTAIRTVVLGDNAADPIPGLDLDGKCTCPEISTCTCPDPSVCLNPLDPKTVCDSPGGVDSQSVAIFKQLSFVTGGDVGSASFSDSAETGGWSIVLRVRDWNGTPDDAQVRFSLYPIIRYPNGMNQPAWDGGDAWQISSAGVNAMSADQPLYFDDAAYVSGGYLVASLPTSAIIFSSAQSAVPLKITAGFVVARIVDMGAAGIQLDEGVLAGRWKMEDIFQTLSEYRDGDGLPICTDNALYGLVKSKFCDVLDIFSGVGTPTVACDSVSLGIGFTAFPAVLGPVVDPPAATPGCPMATDPAGDTC